MSFLSMFTSMLHKNIGHFSGGDPLCTTAPIMFYCFLPIMDYFITQINTQLLRSE